MSRPARTPAALRLAAYLVISGGLVALVGGVVPLLTGMGVTFLTDPMSLGIATAFSVVGGWGLGRDIELEQSLDRARRRAAELAREAELAQLLALRSHLDPHFLFNTLNAIAEWCREDGETAERATLELSSMLRTVLTGVRATAWPLARELELLDTLFSLHLFRDPELFELEREVPELLPDVELPPMVLLPLAENAIKHGPSAGHRGRILLRIDDDDGEVAVTIENPGPFAGPRDGGEGLRIVRRRLELAYQGQARFDIHAEGERTVARVAVPRRVRTPEVKA